MSKRSRIKKLTKAADKFTKLTETELAADIQDAQKERKDDIIEDLFKNPIKKTRR